MSDTFTTIEIRSTLRTLRDYLRDFSESNWDQFQTKLRLFINFCERDDVLRVIARNLHLRAGDVKAWFSGVTAGQVAELPKAAAERLAHQYMTFAEMKRSGIDVRNFISTIYSHQSGGFAAAFAGFKNEFMGPFAAELLRRAERIEAALPQDPSGKVDLGEMIERDLADEPAAAAAPVEKPKAAAKKKDAVAKAGERVDELLKTLESTVKKTKDVVAGKKKDIETDLKILKLALSKVEPNKDVVMAVVKPLERLGGKIAEIAARIGSKVETKE